MSNTRKLILENTLTDELKKHFRIVPQEKYEQVLEQVFEELEYEECSEDTRMGKDMVKEHTLPMLEQSM